MKKIYYTVETTDKNGIENTAIFDTLEEAEKCFYRDIECDDYLATSYLNKNTETELDVETENLISYDGKCVYERFSEKRWYNVNTAKTMGC